MARRRSRTATSTAAPEAPREPALIQLTGICKDYPTPHGPYRALRDVDLEIAAGEFVAVVGRSGAGKTTLINMMTGVDHPTEGVARVGEVELQAMSEAELSRWRGRHLGVIFQSFHLLPGLSLLDNVLLPADLVGRYRRGETRDRALALLEEMGLGGHAHRRPWEISGGQQQRVAIARALINDPPILVADEPTGRLDSVTARGIFSIFEGLVAEGRTIVMVTHDEELAARVPRRLRIRDGEVSDAQA